MGTLRDQLENQKLKPKTEILLERSLSPQEFKELKELFNDPLINLLALHRVLIQRNIKISYSSFYIYSQKCKQRDS